MKLFNTEWEIWTVSVQQTRISQEENLIPLNLFERQRITIKVYHTIIKTKKLVQSSSQTEQISSRTI